MSSFLIKRADSSSYFPPHFEQMEKTALESKGARYLFSADEVPSEGDLILITNTHTRLKNWVSLKDRVKFIIHPNSGFDNLLPDLAPWSGVPVILGNPIRAHAVADWVMAALFQHARPLTHFETWPRSRQWESSLLNERSVLIIGHGHIGKILATTLRSLSVKVAIHDPWENFKADLHAGYDTVILSTSLNPLSQGIIDRAFLSHSPADFLLINPARAELVDEKALRDFLKLNPQARAYLDTHAVEPYPDFYWRDCPQVVASPHIAGVWKGLIDEMLAFESRVIKMIMNKSIPEELLLQTRLTSSGFYR